MDYETLRIFADSWGLVYLFVIFHRRRHLGIQARAVNGTTKTQQTSP